MSSIAFKACRRCTGDLYLEEDLDGPYLTCLRCGNVTYPQAETERSISLVSGERASMGRARA